MSIRGHGITVAIALAGLAVVVAASGTAVAITSTQVNIADPTSPANLAHVGSSGRLTTAGAGSTLNVWSEVFFTSDDGPTMLLPFTSPTTATLAVTGLHAGSYATNHANMTVDLLLVPLVVKRCSTDSYLRQYSRIILRPGDQRDQLYTAPLIIKRPAGGAGYCLALFVTVNGTPSGQQLTVEFDGYVASGTYGGAGTSTPARAQAINTLRTPRRS